MLESLCSSGTTIIYVLRLFSSTTLALADLVEEIKMEWRLQLGSCKRSSPSFWTTTINYDQSTLEKRASHFFSDHPCIMFVHHRGVNLNPLYVPTFCFQIAMLNV